MSSRLALAGAVLALVAGCSPTFDWRETRLKAAPMLAMFPCRPDNHSREVRLGGAFTTMRMASCEAGGATFALASAELPDTASASAALDDLRGTAARNLGASAPTLAPFALAGATASPSNARLTFSGRLPDGAKVTEHAVFFAQGSRVYQGTVIGAAPPPDAVDTFFAGFKFGS